MFLNSYFIRPKTYGGLLHILFRNNKNIFNKYIRGDYRHDFLENYKYENMVNFSEIGRAHV